MAYSSGALESGFLPPLPSKIGGYSSCKLLNTALAINKQKINGVIAAATATANATVPKSKRQTTMQRTLNYSRERPYSSPDVADLSVALHHVFDTPEDKIIWDESAHDAFGVGHSSNSISAGLGLAVGRDLLGKDTHVISVIGNRAITAEQTYQAMGNASYLDSNLIIILNDDSQESAIGGPKDSLFEQLGIHYIGPVDGHSVEDLVHVLNEVKSVPDHGAVLIHIVTKKGKGYPPDEVAARPVQGEGWVGYF